MLLADNHGRSNRGLKRNKVISVKPTNTARNDRRRECFECLHAVRGPTATEVGKRKPASWSRREAKRARLKKRTVTNNALRRTRINDARLMRVQHSVLLVVLPVHLQEMRPEVVNHAIVGVGAVAV